MDPVEVAQEMGYRPGSISKVTNPCLAALNRALVSDGFRHQSRARTGRDSSGTDPEK